MPPAGKLPKFPGSVARAALTPTANANAMVATPIVALSGLVMWFPHFHCQDDSGFVGSPQRSQGKVSIQLRRGV